jgi:protein-disulfide isomerase
MKKEVKFILFPLIALALFALAIFLFNKKENVETTEASQPVKTKIERDGNYSKGKPDAKVTVVEFFDPECEGCAAFHPILQKLISEYPEDVRLVARYMLFHGNSYPAALALEGAGKQGKYWEMYSMLLERQNQWSHQDSPVNTVFEKFASELGLNIPEFNKAYDDLTFKAALAQDVTEGKELGVKGTPTFFVNGKILMQLSYEDLKNAIDKELAH